MTTTGSRTSSTEARPSTLSTKVLLREKYLKKRNHGDPSPLKSTVRTLTDDNLVPGLLNFIGAYPAFSRALFHVHGHVKGLGTRLGKGEVLVWFIFDDVSLGGSSTSHDVIVAGVPRVEIKCARRSGERYVDFMLGIDEVPASLKYFYRALKLFEKADRALRVTLPQNFANIPSSKLEELRGCYPKGVRGSEERYLSELLSGPVGSKTYLFLDAETTLPIFYGKLKRENLKIERVSGGLTRLSLKPDVL